MTQGLRDALLRHGHQVEIVTIPFKFDPAYIDTLIDIWREQDFNDFTGHGIDRVIALQFPAFYVRHHHKILWLMHQHRAVYELFEMREKREELEKLRQKIHAADSEELARIPKRYSMCQNVSNRLERYNGITSEPLYHPPHYASRYYCGESTDYIFYPSRIETLKRQELLIRAMAHTKTPVVAIIAGAGGQYHRCAELIESLRIKDRVRMVGYISQEEKESYYARALGVFFAPFDEDYGYITLEAMLSSKPVLTCNDSGGPLEFIVNDENGFVSEPEPEVIAEKIDWLYENKSKAKAMGEAAKEHYESKNISWDNVVASLV